MISASDLRVAGRVHRLVDLLHAAFGAADDAFVFFLHAAGEDEVGMVRGFGQEEVDHAEELELRQRLAREVRVRQRDQRVEAHREQRLDLAAVDRLHDFDGRQARRRAALRRRCPTRRRCTGDAPGR